MPVELLAKRSMSGLASTPTLLASAAPQVNISTPPLLHLSNISDNHGARKKKVRIGRGVGSGCGKTSGRGQKGQRARGSVALGFEGGQTPLHKRLPKKNRHNPFARPLEYISLGVIQRMIDIGRLDPSRKITFRDLLLSGCLKKVKHGVILRESGPLSTPVHIEVTESTSEAARKVIDAGGRVTLAWYNRLGLRALIKPEKWTSIGMPLPAWARPPPKLQIRYPDRSESNLPIRVLETSDDITAMESAWKKQIHPRMRRAYL